jgi:hypothetical protein
MVHFLLFGGLIGFLTSLASNSPSGDVLTSGDVHKKSAGCEFTRFGETDNNEFCYTMTKKNCIL